jgi:CelD/BcsL family acetyltransferase involved in cellulose biosynthesis
MYRIERTADLASLLDDTGSWTRMAGGIPFREAAWLRPWWDHFAAGRDAYTLVARDDEQNICGVLPLYLADAASRSRTLRMIGDGDAYSDYVSVLAVQGQETAIAAAMAEFLVDHASDADDGWEFIDIDGVIEDDPGMIALARTLSERGASLHAQSRMSTWFKPRDENWDEHLKHFKKTQRRQMRRWSERIEHTEGLELHHASNLPEVHRDLDQVIEMHQRRWNEVGEPGSFADANFRSFMHDAAARFFEHGQLHLSLLRYDDKPIAGDVNLIGGNRRMYCYSAGYDIDSAELEPGRILMVEAIKYMYSEDIAGIDHMRGDEPYKRRMGAIPSRVLRVLVAAPTFWPQLCHAAWWTGFEVKQWMRRRTGRAPIAVVDWSAGALAAH